MCIRDSREVGEFEALKDSAPGAAVEDYGDAAIPVSYTHLDVYKRQTWR